MPSKLQRYANVCRQLSALIASGVPVLRSLETLSGAIARPEADSLAGMKTAIEEGATFTEAAARRNDLFKEHAIALIRAGEESGNLDGVLIELAEFAEMLHVFRKKILTRLAYPVLLFHMAVLVIGLVQFLFNKEGGAVAAVSTMAGILVPLYVIAGAGFFIFKASGTNSGLRMLLEKVLFYTPGIGNVIHSIGLARFSGSFAALYESGVPMHKALPFAAGATGTSVLRQRLAPAAEAMSDGQTIVRALREADVFDEIALGMLFTGLESGRVDEAFRRLEKQHANAASVTIDRLSMIIPGIIYGCVAIFVAILIIKIVAGYVGMINNI